MASSGSEKNQPSLRIAGFAESQAPYAAEDPYRLIGQFRRFGPDGPAYEVVSLGAEGAVHVVVVHSDEKVVCALEDVLADPLAETIP